jgi:hypothetical protein
MRVVVNRVGEWAQSSIAANVIADQQAVKIVRRLVEVAGIIGPKRLTAILQAQRDDTIQKSNDE